MGVKITGADKIAANIAKFEANLKKALGPALKTQAEVVMENSKNRTPHASGNLRDTSTAAPIEPVTTKNSVYVEAGYDIKIAPYARAVHEITSAKHPIGEAKFLENAIHEEEPHIAKAVAADLRSRLGT